MTTEHVPLEQHRSKAAADARPAPFAGRAQTRTDARDPKPTPCSRKTKLIATLGPGSENGEALRGLLEAGVSMFRVNLETVGRETALKAIYAIRSISTGLQRPVSLLLDTQDSPAGADSTSVTERYWADIRFGLESGVDWIAVPASRDGTEARQLRRFLASQKRTGVNILARIGAAEATTTEQGLEDSDGVILDPGKPADGQATQLLAGARFMVEKCVNVRKLLIIATNAPTEIKAALSARPDAVLLLEDAHYGPDQLGSVLALDALIRRAESEVREEGTSSVTLATEKDNAIAQAVRRANETGADAIAVFTRTGDSACLCAALRSRQSTVFAFTPDARLARRLRARYGVEPVVQAFSTRPGQTLRAAEQVLLERKLLARGAKIVFITDRLEQNRPVSSVELRTLGATGTLGEG